MIRESLIRRLPEFAFALLFGGGMLLGGNAALAGLPKFLDAVAPAAKADVNHSDGSARVRLSQGFDQSRFTPQVLYPVTASPKPDWLIEAIRVAAGPPPALRDVRVAQNTQAQRPVIAIVI